MNKTSSTFAHPKYDGVSSLFIIKKQKPPIGNKYESTCDHVMGLIDQLIDQVIDWLVDHFINQVIDWLIK